MSFFYACGQLQSHDAANRRYEVDWLVHPAYPAPCVGYLADKDVKTSGWKGARPLAWVSGILAPTPQGDYGWELGPLDGPVPLWWVCHRVEELRNSWGAPGERTAYPEAG